MAIRYIKTDNRRLTWRECWHLAPHWTKIVLFGTKLLRIPLKLSEGAPLTDNAREEQIAEEAVPAEVRARLEAVLPELRALGFHTPQFCTAKESLLPHVEVFIISMLHSSGEMTAQVVWSRGSQLQPPVETLFCGFQTALVDGGKLVTSNSPRQMDPIPGSDVVYLRGQPLEEAFRTHLRRLEGVRLRSGLRSISSVDRLWAALEEDHRLANECRLARGVWVVMTPEEVEVLRRGQTASPGVPATVPDADAIVLTELEKLQRPRQNWNQALVIFAVTLVLFVAAGSWQWSWRYALMLVPVLLLHELGHYAAMRAFRYQNLRMFFIPFFGAAVSGLRLQAPGWKKAVVSLAGPIPGIVIGGVLAWVSWESGNEFLGRLGRLFIIVNGFNLLPLLPLDGGRVLDVIFFVRSRKLELMALVGAALGLIALSFLGLGKLLLFLGIVLLVGVPHISRTSRIVERLRQRGMPLDPEDAPAISREAATAILAEARVVLPPKQPLPAKTLAEIIMHAYDGLHTRPPGWLGSVTLLGAHGGALILALALFTLDSRMSARQLERWMAEREQRIEPRWIYDCASVIPTAGSTGIMSSNRVTLAATYTNATAAQTKFETFRGELAPTMALTQFGQSLFVSADAPAAAWASNVLPLLGATLAPPAVEQPASNAVAVVQLKARAANEAVATKIADELGNYFFVPAGFHLRPPWTDASALTPEPLGQERKARNTYHRLVQLPGEITDHLEMKAMQARVREAFRSGDTNAIQSVYREQQALLDRLVNARQQELLDASDPQIDPAVVAAYRRQPERRGEAGGWPQWCRDMGRLLGQLPLVNGAPNGPDAELVAHAYVETKGTEVRVKYLTFTRLDRGLPALARFLCERGCPEIFYGLEVPAETALNAEQIDP